MWYIVKMIRGLWVINFLLCSAAVGKEHHIRELYNFILFKHICVALLKIAMCEGSLKDSKATNEQQSMGQVHWISRTIPYRPGILIYRASMSISAHTRPGEARQWLAYWGS